MTASFPCQPAIQPGVPPVGAIVFPGRPLRRCRSTLLSLVLPGVAAECSPILHHEVPENIKQTCSLWSLLFSQPDAERRFFFGRHAENIIIFMLHASAEEEESGALAGNARDSQLLPTKAREVRLGGIDCLLAQQLCPLLPLCFVSHNNFTSRFLK